MRTLSLSIAATLFLLLGACSGDKSAESNSPAPASDSGTSISIDTRDGAMSYETDDGKNSTSITVGGDDDQKKTDD
jgi:hypothetical protein